MMSYKLFVLALLCVLCNAEEVKKEVKEVKTDDALIKEVVPKPDMEVADKVVPIPDEKVEAEPEFIEEGLDDELVEEEESMPVPVEEAPEEEKFEDEIMKEEEEEEVVVPDQDQPAEDPRTKLRITIHFKKSKGKIGKCPSTYPYAFNGGSHCCANRREGHSWPVKSTCNGKRLSRSSTCCSKNKFRKCPHTTCKSRVLFLQPYKSCAIPLNKDQCRAVAKSMKPDVKWDEDGPSWFTKWMRPHGCYAVVDSKNIKEVVWNDSGRSCNEERMCICRRF